MILRYVCAILTKIRVRQQILAELPNFNFVKEKKNICSEFLVTATDVAIEAHTIFFFNFSFTNR